MATTEVSFTAIRNQAKAETVKYYKTLRPGMYLSLDCRWLAKVRNHYKAMFEGRAGMSDSIDLMFETDIWPDCEVVIIAYKPAGLMVSNPIMNDYDILEVHDE